MGLRQLGTPAFYVHPTANPDIPFRNLELVLQMAEEKAAKLAAARLQMEQELADAVAQEAAQAQAQAQSAQQPASSESQHATAESPQASPEARAAESQSQLLSGIRDFVKMAREGIKQRQVALQYARSSWQVWTAS